MSYRIFKIGSTQIVEDEATVSLSNEEVREMLQAQYPEAANATIRETPQENGTVLVEYLPRPGHKG
jgi:hypothetical protein